MTVFEKADRIGGLLRYGIPHFKMEKHLIDRRLDQMTKEGVEFVTNAHIGKDILVQALRKEFNVAVLAGGAEQPRDLPIPGRELHGIHFALDFLVPQNRRCDGLPLTETQDISACGKRVVVIGGGDTGADCVGTAHRQKARSVLQLELLPKPPDARSPSTPWPLWPLQLRTESSHEEGGVRDWGIATTKFSGDEHGNVKLLHATRVGPAPRFEPLPGTEFTIEADLVLLGDGIHRSGAQRNARSTWGKAGSRGNVATDANNMTSVPSLPRATCEEDNR